MLGVLFFEELEKSGKGPRRLRELRPKCSPHSEVFG
jgi:hypothetical protein